MRSLASKLAVLLSVLALSATASAAAEPEDPTRRWGVVFGSGNATGGLGASGEMYFAQTRWSFSGGVGFARTSHAEHGVTRVNASAGVRLYTGGARNRALLELSMSPLAILNSNKEVLYGPAVCLGYQHVATHGFTFMVTGGAGYSVSGPPYSDDVYAAGTIAIGRTWRQRAARP